jgi:hypothetical protein
MMVVDTSRHPETQEPSAEARAARERIVAECRERVRLEDISRAKDELFEALHPAQCHARGAMASLDVDDDVGLEHHLKRFFAAARAAWTAHQTLTSLIKKQSGGAA